ncbi:MAG: porin [Betaproteobacteria bacterium]
MNKKLIALAVAGATFAPAVMAQSANPVTLYGRAWVMFNSVKADGGATPLSTRNTVVNESSLIGIRGTEDLGGGLKAFFQLEMGFNVDENATSVSSLSPAPATTPIGINNSVVTGRNSAVGLQGGFGSVLLGRWDTPMKLVSISVDPFGQNTIGNELTVTQSNWGRRETNSVQYWSPNIAGFAFRGMYAANEGKQSATPFANPSSAGASVTYAGGPVWVGYAWERHKDQLGAAFTANVRETGNTLAGSFVFGPVKFGLLGQKVESPGRTDAKTTFASAIFTMGKNDFVITGGKLKGGALKTAALQPETKMGAVGYNYNFSRRTTFMMRYAYATNNAAANAQLNASGLPGFVVNDDPRGFGVGLRHTF